MLPPLPPDHQQATRRGLPALPQAEARQPFQYPGHHLHDGVRVRSPIKKVTAHKRRANTTGKLSKRQKVVRERGNGDTSSAGVSLASLAMNGDGGITGCDLACFEDELHSEFGNPDSSPPPESEPDLDFEAYIRLVESRCVAFIRISRSVYVVQGWNAKERIAVDQWYHFEAQPASNTLKLACLCPQGGFPDSPCVHMQYYLEFREERFRTDEDLPFQEGKTVAFWRERIGYEEDLWVTRFSVRGHTEGLSSRAVVTYEGLDDGFGAWKCLKDKKNVPCTHIPAARKFFTQIFGRDLDSNTLVSDQALGNEESAGETEDYIVDDSVAPEAAISHSPILPPLWAMLPTDTIHYSRPDKSLAIPPIITLEGRPVGSLCRNQASYDAQCPSIERHCTVYTLTGTFTRLIELQKCPCCPSRRHCYLGPDPRDLGVFNYNNSVLFTHELLDEYTSRYTSSVTPFAAFIQAMSRVYEGRGFRFVKEDLFRSVWFAYASIQDLQNDMLCNHCGTEPENIIWDGVTLAFSKKHLNDCMQPPTVQTSESPVRMRKYGRNLQWMPMKTKELAAFRKRMLSWLRKGRGKGHGDAEDSDEEISMGSSGNYYAELIYIVGILQRVEPVLGVVFMKVFGTELGRASTKPDPALRRRYAALFEQLVAEESAVQMVNESARHRLMDFVKNPSFNTASGLTDIPALMKVVETEMRFHRTCPSDILQLCTWMLDRITRVLEELKGSNLPPLPLLGPEQRNENDWKKTGCCYGLPQIRVRPSYPLLSGDGAPDKGNARGDKCSKYYSTYGERRLTGGIMCAWCTHSICYGFHCIPLGEGRNDVFSAMVTRWPRAPKRVIYDFACALGPYCMTREPEFFANTQFLVDGFHAKGHSKCSSSSFLSTYTEVDANLSRVNSSAAECGNSGIGRIRKAVSYMRQNRAILYTKVFLSIWNRLRILGK